MGEGERSFPMLCRWNGYSDMKDHRDGYHLTVACWPTLGIVDHGADSAACSHQSQPRPYEVPDGGVDC